MIEPTGHHVIVKPDPVEKFSKGGIVIGLDNQHDRELAATTTGILVSIGMNAWQAYDDGKPWAKIGDRVYFTRHVSKIIKDALTQEEFFLMTDDNILAIIKE